MKHLILESNSKVAKIHKMIEQAKELFGVVS